MKTKALDNSASSQLLINNRHYTASVHCSYYAVFQYMKYMLAHTNNRPVSYSDQIQEGADSHENILRLIRDRINDPRKARAFGQEVRDLKKYRVSADYELTEFTDLDGLVCKEKADGLIAKLKTYFGNL